MPKRIQDFRFKTYDFTNLETSKIIYFFNIYCESFH
jgi:hypothetical protein